MTAKGSVPRSLLRRIIIFIFKSLDTHLLYEIKLLGTHGKMCSNNILDNSYKKSLAKLYCQNDGFVKAKYQFLLHNQNQTA